MLRSLKDLERYDVAATDGAVGKVIDFLIEERRWALRYLVVETGPFFHRRQVLISPISFGTPDWAQRQFRVSLTLAQVRESPDIDLHRPVSRRQEQSLHRYYAYPDYWGELGLWGDSDTPFALQAAQRKEAHAEEAGAEAAPHLRSVNELHGFQVHGVDKEIGHVSDLIVDDRTWALRFLVVSTSELWLGRKVLIDPEHASRVHWSDRHIQVDLSRQQIQESPTWSGGSVVQQDDEIRLSEHSDPSTETLPRVPYTRENP